MIVITIAFVSRIPAAYMPESLNAETSHAYHAQGSLISVVCRSSDLSIHVRRIFPRANALLQPSLRAMTALPMTGFHRTRGFPRMENNTLELQLLSESFLLLYTL